MIKNAFFASLMVLVTATTAMADDEIPNFKEEKLTGDWGGNRTNWYKKGVDFTLDYTANGWRNLDGGVKSGGRYLGNLDAVLNLDNDKLFGLKGNTASIYVIADHGGRPNDLVGSLQGLDNQEVGTPAWRLYEAWIDQKFYNDKASIRFGLYDLNSEFYVTDSSGLFLGPTYGIGNEMAVTGKNGPSIFPVTSLAARLLVNPTESTYIQAAILDGVPGSLKYPRGTHVDIRKSEGALLVAEGGYTPKVNDEQDGKFGIGIWRYTKKQDDPIDVDAFGNPRRGSSYGLYAVAEKTIIRAKSDDGFSLSAFARGGITDGDISLFKYSWSTGLLAQSVIPGRSDGQLGLAFSSAQLSDYLQPIGSANQDKSEYSIELTYGDQITPWLWVQPDIQYTINPGIDPALDDATSAAVRATVSF